MTRRGNRGQSLPEDPGRWAELLTILVRLVLMLFQGFDDGGPGSLTR